MSGDAAKSLLPQPRQRRNSQSGGPYGHRFSNFPVGSVVEVRTDEEDFNGVYFTATVLPPRNSPKRSSKKKSKKLYVEYHNLLAQEGGSDRLRENVDMSFVRPGPPLLANAKGFEPDDVVDAFYKDGWWTGVVTRAADDDEKYTVTFPNPPDELKFGIAELRAHWDWVNGSWVRPQKQSISAVMFNMGRKVEVSFDRADSQDVWFPATIHEDLGNGMFLVEHETENSRSNVASVDSMHIRPCPPLLKDRNFVLLEKVDAFFDFGWWSGVITKQLENNRYTVFFKQMKCNKDLNQSELRKHMEWKDGKWFTSSQEPSNQFVDDVPCHIVSVENDSINSSIDVEDSCAGKTHPSLISRKGLEPFVPDNLKLVHVMASLSKRKAHLSDSGSELYKPYKKRKEGSLEGANEKDRHDGSEKEALSLTNMEKCVAQSTRNRTSSNQQWEEKVQRKRRNTRTPPLIRENDSASRPLGKSIAPVSPPVLELVREAEPETTCNSEETQNENKKLETESSIVIDLPSAESGSSVISGGNRSQLSDKKNFVNVNDQSQQVNNSTSQKSKEDNQSGSGGVTEKKKRGRPKKNLSDIPKASVTGNAENGAVNTGDLSGKDDLMVVIGLKASVPNQEEMTPNQKKIANGKPVARRRKVVATKRKLTTKPVSGNAEELSRPAEENCSLERGQGEFSSGKIPVEILQEPWPVDTIMQCVASGDNQHNGFLLEEASEKQPEIERQSSGPVDRDDAAPTEPLLSPCANNTVGVVLDEGTEMQSETATEIDSSVDKVSVAATEPSVENCTIPTQPQNSVEKAFDVVLDEDNEKRLQKGIEVAPAPVDEVDREPCEPENLPFVKSTVFWKTIEAMDVFQKMPQKPHFKPLENVKESSREGLAIGYMVTFSSMVDRTSRLQITDPISTMNDIKEQLADLEKHGFDVSVVEATINELLEMKVREEKYLDDIRSFDKEITERNHDRSRIATEIEEIKGHILRLQTQLSVIEAAKERDDEEIDTLQYRLKETEEGFNILKSCFERVACRVL